MVRRCRFEPLFLCREQRDPFLIRCAGNDGNPLLSQAASANVFAIIKLTR